jgi:bloom syndrome protein
VESLQASRITYQKCVMRKEVLKQGLVRAISEGLDPTSMPDLVRSQDLEAEMKRIEVQVRELLPRAGIHDVACNHAK